MLTVQYDYVADHFRSHYILFPFLEWHYKKKYLDVAMLEAFVKPFEQYSVTSVKYTHMPIHIHTQTQKI